MKIVVWRLPSASVWLFLVGLVLTGCTIKLAPDFDPAIVDGLTSANQQALTFFASVANGSPKSEFGQHEQTYNQLIGKFDALRLQAQARPEPPPPRLFNFISKKLPEDIKKLTSPTPDNLKNIVKKLTDMKNDHKNKGLKKGGVTLFKRSFELKMEQALTYEKALQR